MFELTAKQAPTCNQTWQFFCPKFESLNRNVATKVIRYLSPRVRTPRYFVCLFLFVVAKRELVSSLSQLFVPVVRSMSQAMATKLRGKVALITGKFHLSFLPTNFWLPVALGSSELRNAPVFQSIKKSWVWANLKKSLHLPLLFEWLTNDPCPLITGYLSKARYMSASLTMRSIPTSFGLLPNVEITDIVVWSYGIAILNLEQMFELHHYYFHDIVKKLNLWSTQRLQAMGSLTFEKTTVFYIILNNWLCAYVHSKLVNLAFARESI